MKKGGKIEELKSHSGGEGLKGISKLREETSMSKIEEVRRGKMRLKQRKRKRLNREYHLDERGSLYVSGVLKQKIRACGVRIKKNSMRDVNSSNRTASLEPIKS